MVLCYRLLFFIMNLSNKTNGAGCKVKGAGCKRTQKSFSANSKRVNIESLILN